MFCVRPPLEPGNFSFIKNKTLRFALEYDYIHVLPVIEDLSPRGDTHFNDGKRSTFDSDRPNVWDTPPGEEWKKVQLSH